MDIIFYLKPDGIDSTTCNKYGFACATIDYVMREIVNKTEYSLVYIDSGTYNYSITSDRDISNNGYLNRKLNLIGFFFGPSVKIDNIDSYPIILSNTSDGLNISFLLYANVSASFECLKFIIGNNSMRNRRLIVSLFILYYFLSILFFNNICNL
jgi:hypothetical protein